MTLRISIAMCTYNGSRFLPDQLNSIAIQTRLPDELVVCDDCSADNSVTLVRDFAKQASFPVRAISNDVTLGSTKNFEKTISECRGDVIVLADQDDVWYPNKLALIEHAFSADSTVVAAFSDADLVDVEGHPLRERLWDSVGFRSGEREAFTEGLGWGVLVKHPVVTGATMAFSRSLCASLLPIPEDIIHDRWLSFLLAVRGPIALIREPLMRYRKHSGQQIGVEPENIRDRFIRARWRDEHFYMSEINTLRQFSERLDVFRSQWPQADRVIREVQKKIRHLENRIRLRRRRIQRIPEVFREVCNRGYWKYSAGWESVAKDLFLSKAL